MSRTDLDPATLARSLRRMAGDGSVEWVYEPMQTSVLLDVADMLEDNAKLRELLLRSYESFEDVYDRCDIDDSWRMETALEDMRVCMRELGVEADE